MHNINTSYDENIDLLRLHVSWPTSPIQNIEKPLFPFHQDSDRTVLAMYVAHEPETQKEKEGNYVYNTVRYQYRFPILFIFATKYNNFLL